MSVAGVAHIDPLISPEKQSGHVHAIKGSSGEFELNPFYNMVCVRMSSFTNDMKGLSMNITLNDLLNSNCTSCEVKQDHSTYWTSELYFWGTDSVVEIVPEVAGHVMYGTSCFDEIIRMQIMKLMLTISTDIINTHLRLLMMF